MPLVRLQVRNEYGLGDSEVYKTTQKDDSRALLEGVAVAGLVGILRQLGDLAEFAAELFHDLHDKVAATAARGQHIMVKIQHLESGLPSLEHASLAQTSHIHFAYTAGSDWHASMRIKQNHLIRGDLPGFIMDSYEECRGQPRLFLLDKFDAGGAGACLKRYSDPSFFKMEWAASELRKAEKVKKEKKNLKAKKKSRRHRNGDALDTGSFSRNHNRLFYTLDFDNQNQNIDNLPIHVKSMAKKQSRSESLESFTSGTKTSYMKHLFGVDQDGASKHGKEEYSPSNEQSIQVQQSVICDSRHNSCTEDKFLQESFIWENKPESMNVRSDENGEVLTPSSSSCTGVLKAESQSLTDRKAIVPERDVEGEFCFNIAEMKHQCIPFDGVENHGSCVIEIQNSDVVSEPDNYVDALNIMESEVETDYEGRVKNGIVFHPVYEATLKSVIDLQEMSPTSDKTLPISTSFSNDELAECSLQADIPAGNIPGIHIFENNTDGTLDIEQNALSDMSAGCLNDELARCFSQVHLQNGIVPGTPVPNAVKNGIDSAHGIESELAGPFPQVHLPNGNIPETPVLHVFENDIDPSHDIAMKKSAINNESANHPTFREQLAIASNIATAASENSSESSLEMHATNLNFWTNGGLLGLQPSKPPDFSAAKAFEDNYGTYGYVAEPSIHQNPANCDRIGSYDKIGGDTGKQESNLGQEFHGIPDYAEHPGFNYLNSSELVKNACDVIHSQSHKHHIQRYDGFFEQELQDSGVIESSVKVENGNHSNAVPLEEDSILFSGSKLPVLSITEVQSTVSFSTDAFPTNGLQRKPVGGELGFFEKSRTDGARLSRKSVMFDTTDDVPKTQSTGLLYQPSSVESLSKSECSKESNYIVGSAGNFDSVDSHSSECSSPPLVHMKISFNPVNDLNPSSLKLDLPLEQHFHERIKGTFSPSFHWLPQHLLPMKETRKGDNRELGFLSLNHHSSQVMPLFEEPLTSKQPESELDSDDDTFCKRSLNFSQDMLSLDLESNSEQWEHNEWDGSKVDLYDGLRRISSVASISSSVGLEETSFLSFDPNCHDLKACSNSRICSEDGFVDFSLPTFQNSQTQFQDIDPGSKKLLSSVLHNAATEQSPSTPTHFNPADSIVSLREAQETQQIFVVKQHKTTNRTASTWLTAEREPLLEEIRAKSFSLKGAGKSRSDVASSIPMTNISVAAILEKANSIRQAFAGSEDGGEDDSENWTDD